MFFPRSHLTITMIFTVSICRLAHGTISDVSSTTISNATARRNDGTRDGSYSIIVRLITFDRRPLNDNEGDEQQRRIHSNVSVLNMAKFVAPLNGDADPSTESEEKMQHAFLSSMVRKLLEQLPEPIDSVHRSDQVRIQRSALKLRHHFHFCSGTNEVPQ
jgi:hypothetical protein